MKQDGITRKTRYAYRGKVLDVAVEEVQLPNGNVTDLEILRHPGAAAVVPLLDDGQVVLVRQYRHATGGWLLEVPAGKLDGGEDPEACARREVEEETGFSVGELLSLGWIWTSPGFTDERIWLYLATGLRKVAQSLEPDEVLTIQQLPLVRVVEMARGGDVTDAKSVCALLRALHYLDAKRS